jgi:hypothetical protein
VSAAFKVYFLLFLNIKAVVQVRSSHTRARPRFFKHVFYVATYMSRLSKRDQQAAAAMYRSLGYAGSVGQQAPHDCRAPNYLSSMGQSVQFPGMPVQQQCRDRDELFVTERGFGCCRTQKGVKRSQRPEDDDDDDMDGGESKSKKSRESIGARQKRASPDMSSEDAQRGKRVRNQQQQVADERVWVAMQQQYLQQQQEFLQQQQQQYMQQMQQMQVARNPYMQIPHPTTFFNRPAYG